MNLREKRVVVLGGTSGIGFAVAKAAIRAGASVVVASSREARVAEALAVLGKQADGEVLNLAEEDQIRQMFARLGPFDHLVYTAGESLQLGDLKTADLTAARAFFELRVFGPMAAIKHAAASIRPGGSVTLTHGIASMRPQKGWTIAASICGAIEAFTRAVAVELAPIRVNAVSPGFVRTPLWSGIPEADREAMYRDVGTRLPVGRVGEADDIAQTYLYLMQNAFSTGQTVVIDGGGVLV
jgi:NAD(P)-dependent dehydrogenase (short-subunit alcohol dehydrogenase family)